VTNCQLELHHLEPNGSKIVPIGTTCSEYEVPYPMLNLPQCCLKLQGLHVAVPVDISMQDQSSCTNLYHVTGFMLDYSETKWSDWFSS